MIIYIRTSISMKVIHISSSDINGGAARAAYRIHKSLHQFGKENGKLNSVMRVIKKDSDDYTVDGLPPKGKNKYYLFLLPYLAKLSRLGFKPENYSIHSNAPFPSGIGKELENRYKKYNDEIVHLHWLGDNTLSIEELGSIKQRIIWTLHDQWAFLGAEHYCMNPNLDFSIKDNARFIKGYFRDNNLKRKVGRDINRYTWNRKLKNWHNRMHIVCPSNWMAECAKKSYLMRNFDISVIPYPIDLNKWSPVEPLHARNILNLNPEKKYILFGALGGTKDFRKGSDLLFKALKKLYVKLENSNIDDIEIIIFGQSEPSDPINLGFRSHYFGHLHDDISLRLLYSASDLLVIPSRLDNLPQTGIEAHACGTPVVAFKSGGLEDIVENGVTGLLVRPFDDDMLAESIKSILQNSKKMNLRENSRNRAKLLWDPTKIAKQYLEIYRSK